MLSEKKTEEFDEVERSLRRKEGARRAVKLLQRIIMKRTCTIANETVNT